jgi:hypothetical protein
MSKSPPIPPEQRSFRGPRPSLKAGAHEPGEADAGRREQGRHDAMRQNVSAVQHRTQDR